MFFNFKKGAFSASFFTFYALHRQFHIRDEDVFTTVFYKKMHVENTRFSKPHLEIKLFFFKKSDFFKENFVSFSVLPEFSFNLKLVKIRLSWMLCRDIRYVHLSSTFQYLHEDDFGKHEFAHFFPK